MFLLKASSIIINIVKAITIFQLFNLVQIEINQAKKKKENEVFDHCY